MPRQAAPRHQKMADAMRAAKAAAAGGSVFRAKDLTRAQLELLKTGHWLLEMHMGWHALIHAQDSREGNTVPYYSNYWEFVRKYLNDRLGNDYALSAHASLALHTDCYTIPNQLSVHTTRSTQGIVNLPNGLSIAVIMDRNLSTNGIVQSNDGLRLLSLEQALAAMPAASYRLPSPELKAAIAAVRNIAELTRIMLASPSGGPAAGRLTEALGAAGRGADADSIKETFAAAGVEVGAGAGIAEGTYQALSGRPKSGIAARLTNMWRTMSQQISSGFVPTADKATFKNSDVTELKNKIREIYAYDAYNSLSIEGYSVTPELIERVARGDFNESLNSEDRKETDALAARGYFEAYNKVIAGVAQVHGGMDLTSVLERACLDWRVALFSPMVTAGLLPPDSLAGYRNKPVYIRNSLHVPPPHEKLMDAMESLFDCIRAEQNPWARAVLAHYAFVNIHPFPDGNGRVGRFLMNAILVTAGFDWTVVRVSHRPAYFAALEQASTKGDIMPLSTFLAREMTAGGKGESLDPGKIDREKSEPSTPLSVASAHADPQAPKGPKSDCVPPGCSDGPTRKRTCAAHRKR